MDGQTEKSYQDRALHGSTCWRTIKMLCCWCSSSQEWHPFKNSAVTVPKDVLGLGGVWRMRCNLDWIRKSWSQADIHRVDLSFATASLLWNCNLVSMISVVGWNMLLGVRALYKGLGPTLVRTFPATGALFLAVETTKKVFGDAADYYGIVWCEWASMMLPTCFISNCEATILAVHILTVTAGIYLAIFMWWVIVHQTTIMLSHAKVDGAKVCMVTGWLSSLSDLSLLDLIRVFCWPLVC